ncbi:MAG: hypothetical protein EOO01_27675, partial [Chitinophagaceae bacterium]
MKKVALYLSVFALFLFLSSCRDEALDRIIAGQALRLSQQNMVISTRNDSIHYSLLFLIRTREFESMVEYYSAFEELHDANDALLSQIVMAKKNVYGNATASLFRQYSKFMSSFRKLRSEVIKPEYEMPYANAFIDLDQTNFAIQYGSATDSLTKLSQLLTLEADLSQNYRTFLQNVFKRYTPGCPFFNSHEVLILPGKRIYKKGEQLDVRFIYGFYLRSLHGEAMIENRRVMPDAGIFKYSRKINESPGNHKIACDITLTKLGERHS